MELNEYFFDTYALHEVIMGNPAYGRFTKGVAIITSRLNLMELYYCLLLKFGQVKSEFYFEQFRKYCVETDDMTIKEAMQFRFRHRKKRMSYADCIGYCMARSRGIAFLTGDKQFEGMAGVEFVK